MISYSINLPIEGPYFQYNEVFTIRKDDKGRIHLKLVFYGPSLGGKTTALRWLYGKVEGLQKGEFTEIGRAHV